MRREERGKRREGTWTTRYVVCWLLTFFCLTAAAQLPINTKFGKPTKEEMEMTVYSADSTADAVVLCRLTTVTYTVQMSGYLVDYNEKFRIKVLKPEGARFAQVTVPYYKNTQNNGFIAGSRFSHLAGVVSFDYAAGSMTENAWGNFTDENVEDVKAVAFNLVNGKTVKTNMKKDAITTEKIDNENFLLKFNIPEVREGTVIEYEYNIHSELFYMLRDWQPQCDIPVVYASLDMDIPCYLIFNMEEWGIQRLKCRCVGGILRYKLESDPLAKPVVINTNHYYVTGQDLKAMPKVPYVWNMQDHRAGITAELRGYSQRGSSYIEFLKDWEQVDRLLINNDFLGKQLDNHSPLREELQAAGIAEIADERERAAATFRFISSRVKWNGKYQIWPLLTSETVKNGSGTNADINMLLLQSLHDMQLQAYPVVLRSRDEGRLPHNFPTIQKLSTFIVAVILQNGTKVYLDASAANGYLDVLPDVLQVERARLLVKGKGQWVNLQQLPRSQTKSVINATLSADGTLTGTQVTTYTGTSALLYRQQHNINDFAPSVTDSTTFTRKGIVEGNTITICPFNTPPVPENPFVNETRVEPVEFPFAHSDQLVVNITLPDGYTVEKLPESLALTTNDKSINGKMVTSREENRVQVLYHLNINKIEQPQTNYGSLRQLFELFAEHSKDVLVIKK